MFTKIKEKVTDSAISILMKKDAIKNRKGDTNLIVIVLLLGVVAVAVYFFQGQFMDLLEGSMAKLKDKFNNIWDNT